MSLAADSATFINEAVSFGKKGQQLTLTFGVSGLPAGSNPVVGVFNKQGQILGRTEWQTNTSNPTFAKQFTIKHGNSTELTFSVYNASDAVSATDYLGGVTADLKNLMGNGGKNEVTEGGLTFAFNCAVAQKAAKKKEEKKVDPKVAEKLRAKLVAKCEKEGGKKAQDIAGLRDMGGVSYFHVSLNECGGDWELIQTAMTGMNTPCPEDADERRGGAEEIGKALMSYDDEKLCIYMHVPANLQELCKIGEWFGAMTEGYTVVKPYGEGDANFLKAEVAADPDNNIYPIKVRDDMINKGYQHLTAKQLVMPDDGSDDDMVFGDDDFMM